MPLLSLTDLRAEFTTPAGRLSAVDGVSLALEAGETLGLVGESGCGKSSLGKAIPRLADPTGGSIRFDGEEVTTLRGAALRRFRRRAQMIFQDPFASLNPRHTIGEILETPLKVHGLGARAARRAAAGEILARVGLPPESIARYPHEFSGGQRQRIGIARALITKPELVICDEPVSALDVSIQAQILNLLVEMKRALGLSYLFISHDLAVVRYFADRVLVMYLGRIVEEGAGEGFWTAPAHPYARALIASVPDPARRREAAPITGEPPGPLDVPPGCRFHPRCPFATALCRSEEPAMRDLAPGRRVACHHAERLLNQRSFR